MMMTRHHGARTSHQVWWWQQLCSTSDGSDGTRGTRLLMAWWWAWHRSSGYLHDPLSLIPRMPLWPTFGVNNCSNVHEIKVGMSC